MTTCKNCSNSFEGKYCNNCGQKADTGRIDANYLWHEIQHGVFHLDKGVFFTIKELFIRPGYTIKEYFEGKRIGHFKPLAFVFILAGILGILRHYLPFGESRPIVNNNIPDIIITFVVFAKSHLSIAELIFLPFIALASKLAFRKSNYNYFEHLILNSFILGQNIVINIMFLPFCLINNEVLNKITYNFLNVLFLILIIWTYFQFFYKSNIFRTIINIILTFVFFIMELILLVILFFL